jgi:hypothetical protein
MSNPNKKNHLKVHQKRRYWPMILLLVGGLLLVIGVIFAFTKPAQPRAIIEVNGAPSLKVDKQKVDLGEVKLGQTVEVKFTMTNLGDQPLRFSKTPYIEVLKGC